MRTIAVLGLLAIGQGLRAQQPKRACQQVNHEYQVEHQARFLPDSTLDMFPIDTVGNPRNLVEFVVDSSGRVVPSSFRPLRVASEVELEAAMALLPHWRYDPATNDGRSVCQLIQTYLKRSSKTGNSPSNGKP